jgi:hypothetical protein
MTNTSTLTSFKIPNQIKDDFHTVCKLNQSSMTSEIVRLVTHFISSENTRLKSYQLTSKEINELKQRKLTTKPPVPQLHRTFKETRWEDSF